MAKEEIERLIRSEKRNTESVEEQIAIATGFWEEKILPDQDGIKASEVEDGLDLDLDYRAKTSLHHLEEVGLVEEYFPPGPEILAIAEWRNDGEGEVVLGEVEEAAIEGLEARGDRRWIWCNSLHPYGLQIPSHREGGPVVQRVD